MPSFDEIATKQDLLNHQQAIAAMLSKLVEPSLEKLNDYLMTVEEVARVTKHDERTVRNWITKGKKDIFGDNVKLVAEEYCPGIYRVLKSELLNYGRVKWQRDTGLIIKVA